MKKTMRQSLALLLALLMVFGSAPLSGLAGPKFELPAFLKSGAFGLRVRAEEVAGVGKSDIYYYSIDGNEATITDCSEYATGDIVIPDTLGGVPVTSIGSRAFQDCTGLTSVTIPDSVTSIGSDAFYYCIRLARVVIPDSVTSIGSDAFRSCSSLASVVIPDSVTSIGDRTFAYCSSLASVVIPKSVTNIHKDAFSGCANLTIWCFSDSIANTYAAFYDIPFIVIQKGFHVLPPRQTVYSPGTALDLTGIGLLSVDENSHFTLVDIADCTVSGYDASTFGKQTISVTYDGQTASFDVSVFNPISLFMFDIIDDKTVTITGFDSTFFGDLAIPSTLNGYPVTRIGSGAFRGSEGLTNVVIPDGVTSIGYRAFEDLYHLISITIPSSVTSIWDIFGWYSHYPQVIYGAPGSAAEACANSNGILFLPTVEGFYMIHLPTEKTCLVGDSLDFSGIGLYHVNADGVGRYIDVADCTVTGYNPNLLGVQTIRISYLGQRVTFVIRVLYEAYPESDHPYANNTDKTWRYNHPHPAESLAITFSHSTGTSGYIFLYNEDGRLLGKYSGDGLAGKTITVPGDSFSIRLAANYPSFGFKIDSIDGIGWSAISPAEGSDCVVDTNQGIIHGLKAGVTKADIEADYLQLQPGYGLEFSSDTIGTGTVVNIVEHTRRASTALAIASFTVVIHGDINGDGQLSAQDALMTLQNASGLAELDAIKSFAADVNKDNKISSVDALQILQSATGLLD